MENDLTIIFGAGPAGLSATYELVKNQQPVLNLSPEVQVARIQNFKNWSPAMVPDNTKTSLGLEYYCFEGDKLWNRQGRHFSL